MKDGKPINLKGNALATATVHRTRARKLIGKHHVLLSDQKISFRAEVTRASDHPFENWHLWHVSGWVIVLHRNQVQQIHDLFDVQSQSSASLQIPVKMVSCRTHELIEHVQFNMEVHYEETGIKTFVTCHAGSAHFAVRVRRLVRMCKTMLCASEDEERL